MRDMMSVISPEELARLSLEAEKAAQIPFRIAAELRPTIIKALQDYVKDYDDSQIWGYILQAVQLLAPKSSEP